MLQVLNTIAGASAMLGVLGLIAYFYMTLRARQLKHSIREVVEGDPLFNAQQIVSILNQFATDQSRLDALRHLTEHDSTKAALLLKRFGSNDQLEGLSQFAKKETRRKGFGGAGLFFIAIAIIALIAATSQKPSVADTGLLQPDSVACEVTPPQHQASSDAVHSALDNGQYPYALTLAEAYVKSFPGDANAYRLKGIAHYHLGQYDPAIEAYDRALGICKTDRRVAFNKAAALSELGDLTQAHSLLTELLKANEQDLDCRLNLAFVQLRSGQLDEARKNYHRIAIHQNAKPLLPSAKLGMGMAVLLDVKAGKERIKGAIKDIEHAVCLERDLEDILLLRRTEIRGLTFRSYGPLLNTVSARRIPEYERLLKQIKDRNVPCA